MNTYIAYYFSEAKIDSEEKFVRVANEEEAQDKLRTWVNSLGYLNFIGIDHANFGDAFFKIASEPTQDDLEGWSKENGLEYGELSVRAPGTHPGGNTWWVTPNVNIFVAVVNEKSED